MAIEIPHVRPARPDDVAAIAFVHHATWLATYRGLVPDAFLDALAVETMARRRRGSLGNPATVDLVALDDAGEVVGFAAGGPERDGDVDFDGELYALYVLPGSQTRGLGRALTRAMAEALAARGYAAMLVWVLAENPARRFYEAMGGVAVREKEVEIGGEALAELGYGWAAIATVGR